MLWALVRRPPLVVLALSLAVLSDAEPVSNLRGSEGDGAEAQEEKEEDFAQVVLNSTLPGALHSADLSRNQTAAQATANHSFIPAANQSLSVVDAEWGHHHVPPHWVHRWGAGWHHHHPWHHHDWVAANQSVYAAATAAATQLNMALAVNESFSTAAADMATAAANQTLSIVAAGTPVPFWVHRWGGGWHHDGPHGHHHHWHHHHWGSGTLGPNHSSGQAAANRSLNAAAPAAVRQPDVATAAVDQTSGAAAAAADMAAANQTLSSADIDWAHRWVGGCSPHHRSMLAFCLSVCLSFCLLA